MKPILIVLAACVSAFAQSYPSAIVTDAQLGVAKNNLQIKLLSPVGISDTTIVTSSNPTGFAANMMATVDKEIMFVCAVSGNTLTIGTPTTCPSTSGRGYDGTTAATHNMGPCSSTNLTGCVSAYIIALHHNGLRQEVEAIESTLGINLANVAVALPVKTSTSFNFASQTPGGSLVNGNNSITLAPVPQGVNGTDTGHQLYVSGGTGTAEACLITGGTGTSGSGSGQIIINCANSHTGAWTITSATNGMSEAAQVLATAGTGGVVQLPPGQLANCGGVVVPGDGIVFAGAGSAGNGPILAGGHGVAGTIIEPCFANQTLFSVTAGHGNAASSGLSTVALLSMHDVAFYNATLSGITAISLLRDTNGIFHNLSFYGASSTMKAFNADRVSGTKVRDVMAYGLVTSFFGSSTDTDGTTSYPYAQAVQISGYWYSGQATSAAITFQRCTQCILSDSSFNDQTASGLGTAISALNDTQGLTITHVSTQGYGTHIDLESNTVGSTTNAPAWTTITDAQLDCAPAASGSPSAGCGYTGGSGSIGIHVGAGTAFTTITNPTLTGSVAPNGLIYVEGNGTSLPNVRVNGGLVQASDGNGIVVKQTISNPINAVSITDATLYATASSFAPMTITGGAINNFVFTGNSLFGPSTGSFVTASSGAVNSGYIGANFCSNDINNYCGQFSHGGPLLAQDKTATLTLVNGANQNAAIGAATLLHVSGPSSAYSIGGIQNGFDGRWVTIFNAVSQTFTITNNDSGSSAANRILTGTGATITVKISATLFWDPVPAAWVVASYN